MPGVTIRLLFCVSCWPQHVDSPSRIPLFSTRFFSPPPAWLTSLLQLPLLPAPSRFPSLRIPSIVCDLYTQGIQGEGFVHYVYISLERFATKRRPWQPYDHNIEMKHPPCLLRFVLVNLTAGTQHILWSWQKNDRCCEGQREDVTNWTIPCCHAMHTHKQVLYMNMRLCVYILLHFAYSTSRIKSDNDMFTHAPNFLYPIRWKEVEVRVRERG